MRKRRGIGKIHADNRQTAERTVSSTTLGRPYQNLFFFYPSVKKTKKNKKLAGTSRADNGMTPAAGGELNEKILAGFFSESNVKLLELTFPLQQYAGNWIINSLF